MGDMMEYFLENTLQHDDKYYPDGSGAQNVSLPDVTIIPILYDGVLPYIPVQCPTPE